MKEEVTLYHGFSALFEKKADDPAAVDNGLIHFTFSTDDVDSYGDTIDQEGWVLDRYAKNPIILWAHDHKTPGIGFARNVTKSPALAGDILFNPKEIDPFGAKIKDLILFGTIKAGSVGLNPIKWDVMEKKENGYTEIIGFNFLEQELMEFSICNVPANPFALADPKAYEPKTKTSNKPRSGGFKAFLTNKE